MTEEEQEGTGNSAEERYVFDLSLDSSWEQMTLAEKAEKVRQIREQMQENLKK